MSTGSFVGGALGGLGGGIVGFFVGGPAGAVVGGTVGFGFGVGVGTALDMPRADVPMPATMEITVPDCSEGSPIPDLLGTGKLVGIFVWYGNNYNIANTSEVSGGKGGGGSQEVVTGYTYYLSMALFVCKGNIDAIYAIFRDQDMVWDGNLTPDGDPTQIDGNFNKTFSPAGVEDDGCYGRSINVDGFGGSDTVFFMNNAEYIFIGGAIGEDDNGAFVLFSGVMIPHGATINSAYLSGTGYDDSGSGKTSGVKLRFEGAAYNDAVAPINIDQVYERTRTAARVDDENISTDITDGVIYTSPDLKTIIQEIVDRDGWESGNSILIFIKDNGCTELDYFKLSSTVHLGGTEKIELDVSYYYVDPNPEEIEDSGCSTIDIDGIGQVDFYFGNQTTKNSTWASLHSDSTLLPPYKGISYAYCKDNIIGTYNRSPIYSFIVRKTPQLGWGGDGYRQIGMFDYNPVHAIYYIMTEHRKIPTTFFNEASFLAAAITIFNEGRGVTIQMVSAENADAVINDILQHIGGILRKDVDSKFEIILNRELTDDELDNLETITTEQIISEPHFTRKTWFDTVNEVKVQFPQRVVMVDGVSTTPSTDPTGTGKLGTSSDSVEAGGSVEVGLEEYEVNSYYKLVIRPSGYWSGSTYATRTLGSFSDTEKVTQVDFETGDQIYD